MQCRKYFSDLTENIDFARNPSGYPNFNIQIGGKSDLRGKCKSCLPVASSRFSAPTHCQCPIFQMRHRDVESSARKASHITFPDFQPGFKAKSSKPRLHGTRAGGKLTLASRALDSSASGYKRAQFVSCVHNRPKSPFG